MRLRALAHAPQALRALVRADELGVILLACAVGFGAGLATIAIGWLAQGMHELLFGLDPGQRLSRQVAVDPVRALAVPALGGLILGGLGWWLAKVRPRRVVDPIEANALHGGELALKDSLILVGQTLLSNGTGASVGLEAAFTQLGSALGSRLGRGFRLRRAEMRLMVGCGAAAAIAAAFNAPLTGAFYAFELIIGTYTLATLAPVLVASITGVSLARLLEADPYGFDVRLPTVIEAGDYLPILILGVLAAVGGIALMRGVTLTEAVFRRSRVPPWIRPAIGGLAVGGLALVTPQVLSSGHAALQIVIDAPYPWQQIALLIVLKAGASAISLGSGFRGGLFFASLFLGALVGKLFAGVLGLMTVAGAVPPVVCAVVGMSALATAVVGGPLTMTFLALETTGSLPLTVAVVASAVLSAVTVRRMFGYSFATWRFHLRGEAIRSAVDVGWIRSLTVGRMMRREVRTVRADLALGGFRRDFPLGAATQVVAVDEADRYAGIILVADAHAANGEAARVGEVLRYTADTLQPQMTVRDAMAAFERAESDALAVLDADRRVIGLLTEQHALRRYSEELDRRRRELSGE